MARFARTALGVALGIAVLAFLWGGFHNSGNAADLPGPPVQSKGDELLALDKRISAAMIGGNPTKYTGSVVKIRCVITNVLSDGQTANAQCGRTVDIDFTSVSQASANIDYTDPDVVNKAVAAQTRAEAQELSAMRDNAMLVLVGPKVKDLDADQKLTILGTVLGPMQGKTAFGGTREFPTVRVDYVQ